MNITGWQTFINVLVANLITAAIAVLTAIVGGIDITKGVIQINWSLVQAVGLFNIVTALILALNEWKRSTGKSTRRTTLGYQPKGFLPF